MINDTIADLLTRIRNAQRAGHRGVRVRSSKASRDVLKVLKAEGFIEGFELRKDKENKFDEFEVVLRYYSTGEPVINSAQRVSKPGQRVYARYAKLSLVESGLGISIISTSRGVMSDRMARRQKVGGEILAFIS